MFFRQQIEEAAVVDAAGRCVGMLSVADLFSWALGEVRAAAAPPAACPYQVRGRLLTGADAVICTRAQGSCPLEALRPMTGGRHTAVCLLPNELVSDWQTVSGGAPANAVRRYLTANVPTVGVKAPLADLARAVIEAHVHRLIVVDEQHRPIGTVSCLEVLAALARCRAAEAGG